MQEQTRREIVRALAEVVIPVVLEMAILAFAAVVQWFRNFRESIEENDIAFTLRQELSNGRHTIVQGIFDHSTDQVKQARRINATQLDPKLSHAHAQNKLVIYT
jgi:hypothetical protein